MGTVEIRAAGADQIELVRALAERIWSACYRGIISDEQIRYMLDWMYSAEAIERDMREGISYELIECDQKPIGYLAYGPGKERTWKLHKLYLLPEFHGRGIGQRAMHHAAVAAFTSGARRLTLNVNKQNTAAIRAYERAGFQIATSVVNEIGNGFVMDDYVLIRDLPSPGNS